MSSPQLYTLSEFAVRYRVTDKSVRKAIRRGDLKAVAFGTELRIPDPGWKIMRFYEDRVLYMEHFIRTGEICRLLNISRVRLCQYVDAGYLHPQFIRRHKYFSLADVIQCANRRQRFFDHGNPEGGHIKKGSRGKIDRKLVIDWAIREAKDLAGTVLGPERPLHPYERFRRQEQAAEVWLMPSGD